MFTRRVALAGATAALGLAASRAALAEQLFQSLFIFVPAGPGGGWDGLARAIELVARPAGLVGSFQFENVGGAGGMVGLPRFVSSRRGRPDALMTGGAIMVGAALTNRSPVSVRDVTPVARLTEEAGAIVVPADSEFRDVRGFLDALSANPGAVSVAGGSAGGIDHITLGIILASLGKSARQASYVAMQSGAQVATAIMGAQVKAAISGWSEFSEQIKAGRMRVLATTGGHRNDPNVPTLKDSGLDIVTTNWRGVWGAPGITPAARKNLVDLMIAIHRLPAWGELLKTRGWDDAFLPGDEFSQFIESDYKSTEKILKEIGLV
ncbi:MAG: tripartite tricarboxylate transporter substrate binding protein [Acetobacteraceae bacterium]|nr:tripartite tricarboxylate transporter substrate binding protein [Acetobacteraceae bacterium]